MEIKLLNQMDFDVVKSMSFDIFIAASGYESRASWQVQQFAANSNQKFALAFKNENDDLTRIKNDEIFTNLGFQLVPMDSENVNSYLLDEMTSKYAESEYTDPISIYVDYSSMTKDWYAHILHLISLSNSVRPIHLYFAYSHGIYEERENIPSLNRVVKPLNGYCELGLPSKPTALIICLGNEPNRIIGLTEYFDAVPYLFYSDGTLNAELSNEVELLNKDVIENTNPDNIIKYPIQDLIYTNYLINNLCNDLAENFRIVIAPCGPKPFALLAMINSIMINKSIEVWRISPGDSISKIDRKASGRVSVLKVVFEP